MDVLIKPGQSILVPKDVKLFQTHIARISEYARVGKLNQKMDAGKIDEITVEPIFASSVRSIGLPNVFRGFRESQKLTYEPIHPRGIDRAWENNVNCARALRSVRNDSIALIDLTPEERKFEDKQKIDAWMLPTELMNVGFEQKFPEIIATMFDPNLLGGDEPIRREKLEEYRNTVKMMNAYLEQGGETLVGSYVPYYFKRSHSKTIVADYNRGRKDKHYNTHQSMFIGNSSMSFGAWNVPLVADGVMKPF